MTIEERSRYHVVKRDGVINLNPKNRRKKGRQWFTQTKIGGLPIGSKCDEGDLIYEYEIDYGVVSRGQILSKKIRKLQSWAEVFDFVNNDAEYKNASWWGRVILEKLSKRKGAFDFFVLEVQVELEHLDEVIIVNPDDAKLKTQGSWIYLQNPIEAYAYDSELISPVIPPSLRQKIQILFNSVSDEFVYDIDHFVPRNWGGPGNIVENLVPLPMSVNRNKSDKIPAGLFAVAAQHPAVNDMVTSEVYKAEGLSQTKFFSEIEAKEDAFRVTSAINSLQLDEVREFYGAVRRYHYGTALDHLTS